MANVRSITPNDPADFTPVAGNYKELQPFRYWCHKVLPLVYDDSLSYYELLCKVVDYLNKTMEDVDTLHGDVVNLHTAYEELQNYVNNYFSTLDVQEEINNKLDEMASDGRLSTLITPTVESATGEWLSKHITPTSPALDKTLTVFNASAESSITGNTIRMGLISCANPPITSNIKPNNLIQRNRVYKGYYVDRMGIINKSDAFWLSAPTVVYPNETLTYYNDVGLTAFYDSTFNFVSTFSGGHNVTVTVPSNAHYALFSIKNDAIDDGIVSRTGSDRYDNGEIEINTTFIQNFRTGNFDQFEVDVQQTTVNPYTNSVQTDYVNTQKTSCYIFLPSTYSISGSPVKLACIVHGAGKNAIEWSKIESYQNIVHSLASNGFAVFDCNGVNNSAEGGSYWGNILGTSCYMKAYQYIQEHYNVKKELAVYGFSMGGMTALQLANSFPPVTCIALGSPVISLKEIYDGTESSTQNVIRSLYGMGETYDTEKTIGQDPYSAIIDGKYTWSLPPCRIFFGELETSAPSNTKGLEAYNAMRASGLYANFCMVPNGGHEICYGENTNVIREIVTWFLRFYQ